MQVLAPHLRPGMRLDEAIRPHRPAEPFDFNRIKTSEEDRLFVICEPVSGALLRGQMKCLGEEIFFLGSPWLNEGESLARVGLSLSNFAVHDPTLDVIMAGELQKVAGQDLKKFAERLKKSELMLRGLFAALPLHVVISDQNGDVRFSNAFLEKQLAARSGMVGSKPCDLFVDPAWQSRDRAAEEEVLTTGATAEYEILSNIDGQAHWFRAVKFNGPDTTDGARSVGTLTWEITKQRKAEFERAQFAAIVDSAEDAIIGKNLGGIVSSWNPASERLFGYTAAEMIGASVMRLYPSKLRDEGIEIRNKIQRGERTAHFDTVRIRKDGQPVQVSVTISPVREPTGHIVGTSTILRDVTQQKALEEAAQVAAREATRLAQMQREFVSMVSHEFRTPLTALTGAQFLLKNKLADSSLFGAANAAQIGKWLDHQSTALSTLTQLVNQVLVFNRINHAGEKPDSTAGYPSHLLAEIVDIFNETALEPRLQYANELPPDFSTAFRQPQMKAAVENLLSNALKYSPAETPVNVRAFPTAEGWAVEVVDQGRGIPKEDQADLFQPFFRARNTGSQSGAGLGLSIVQQAVALHGGRVEFSSDLNKGSRFTLYFPLVPDFSMPGRKHHPQLATANSADE